MPDVIMLGPDDQSKSRGSSKRRQQSEGLFLTPFPEESKYQASNSRLPSLPGSMKTSNGRAPMETPCPESGAANKKKKKPKRHLSDAEELDDLQEERKKKRARDKVTMEVGKDWESRKTQDNEAQKSIGGVHGPDIVAAREGNVVEQNLNFDSASTEDGAVTVQKKTAGASFAKKLRDKPRPSVEQIPSGQQQRQESTTSSSEQNSIAGDLPSSGFGGTTKRDPSQSVLHAVSPMMSKNSSSSTKVFPIVDSNNPSLRTHQIEPRASHWTHRGGYHSTDILGRNAQIDGYRVGKHQIPGRPGKRQERRRCVCGDVPPYFRRNAGQPPKRAGFCGTDAEYLTHARRIVSCGSHHSRILEECQNYLDELESKTGDDSDAHIYIARDPASLISPLRINLHDKGHSSIRPQVIRAEEAKPAGGLPTGSHVDRTTLPESHPRNKNANEPGMNSNVTHRFRTIPETPNGPAGQASSSSTTIDLTKVTPPRHSNISSGSVPSPSPNARRFRLATVPPRFSRQPRSPWIRPRTDHYSPDRSRFREALPPQTPRKLINKMSTDVQLRLSGIENTLRDISLKTGARASEAPNTNAETHRPIDHPPRAQHPLPPRPPPSNNQSIPPQALNAAATAALYAAPTVRSPQPRPQAPAADPPRPKKKRLSAAEMRQRKPELDATLPPGGAAPDADLIAIGKIITPYERHRRAPYAFHWSGRLHAKYKYLLERQGTDGLPGWTAAEVARLFR